MRKRLREEGWRGSETSQTSQPTGDGMNLRRRIRTAFNHNLIPYSYSIVRIEKKKKKPLQLMCGLQINFWLDH